MNELKTMTVEFKMKNGDLIDTKTYGTKKDFPKCWYKRKYCRSTKTYSINVERDSFVKVYSITTKRDIFINLKEVETVAVKEL